MAHDHQAGGGAALAHGSGVRGYAIGFVLALILTLIPFGLVMTETLSRPATLAAIFVAALAQVAVHLHYFLHLDRSSAMRWNVMAILFAFLVVLLLGAGTLWIMHYLHLRMM